MANKRLKLAVLTPFPPDKSGIADYSQKCFAALETYADVDVYSDCDHPERQPMVKGAISAYPYVCGKYDHVIAVLGNSHKHHRTIFELLQRYGGPCIQHDNRMSDYYNILLGPRAFAAFASEKLGRTVTTAEIKTWAANPDHLPDIFFHDLIPCAKPLMVHSIGIAENVERLYGVKPVVLPYPPYRHFEDAQLTPAAIAAARREINAPAGKTILVSMGIIDPLKGLYELIDAAAILKARQDNFVLYFVGEPHPLLPLWQRYIDAQNLGDTIRFMPARPSAELYNQFVIAADAAIQLRSFGLGGLSGAVMDCIAAGLPHVTTAEIKRMTHAPDYCVPVSQQFTPTEIASAITQALNIAHATPRASAARTDYLAHYNFDAYAKALLNALSGGQTAA